MAASLLRRRPLDDDTLDRAIRLLDEALTRTEGRGSGLQLAIMYGNRSWALLKRGRSADALADSKASARFFDEVRRSDPQNAFIQAAMRAQVLAAASQPDVADWAAKAQELATQHGLGETSISPEIRRHAKWLQEHYAAAG
jgi:hypothetical protein